MLSKSLFLWKQRFQLLDLSLDKCNHVCDNIVWKHTVGKAVSLCQIYLPNSFINMDYSIKPNCIINSEVTAVLYNLTNRGLTWNKSICLQIWSLLYLIVCLASCALQDDVKTLHPQRTGTHFIIVLDSHGEIFVFFMTEPKRNSQLVWQPELNRQFTWCSQLKKKQEILD